MIFQISPKLSVARDLPQTYRQTVPQTRLCNSKTSITKSVVDIVSVSHACAIYFFSQSRSKFAES